MSSEAPTARTGKGSRLRGLTDELRALEERLRAGGGASKIQKQHEQGKLTARERVELLLDKIASVSARRGAWARAAELAGAAEASEEGVEASLEPGVREFRERLVAEIRAALGDEAFERAVAVGRTLTPDDAVALALETDHGSHG
jgi:hypothetical protein